MEIQESSLPGFYCSRLFGLAPYLIKRNAKGRIEEIRRSPFITIYSVFVLTVAVSMTVRFIFVDVRAEVPVR